jgi:hypothetical protein
MASSLSEEFSLSSVLWRAGWTPTGLLSFARKPLPLTLARIVALDGGYPLSIPAEASVRAGGGFSFEVVHAAFAPAVVRSQLSNSSSSNARASVAPDEEMLSADSNRAEVRVERDAWQCNMPDGAPGADGFHADSGSAAAADPRRRRVNSNDALLELMAATAKEASFFGGPALSYEDARLRIRTQLWEDAPAASTSATAAANDAGDRSGDTPVSSTSSSAAGSPAGRRRAPRGRSLGVFSVVRTWRQWRRAAALIRELHPELLLPPLELLRDVTGNSSNNANILFSAEQRRDMLLEFVRVGIASMQRCSAVAARSPLVVMLLFEEDGAAFERFLAEAEELHRVQSEEETARCPRHMIPSLPEFDQVHVRRQPPPGVALAANEQERQRMMKEATPGFFSKLFSGSGSQPPTEFVVPLSAQDVQAAKQRVQTADQMFRDVRQEQLRWEERLQRHAALDTVAHEMWFAQVDLCDALKDGVDVLAEAGGDILNLPCPFGAAPSSPPSPSAAAPAATANDMASASARTSSFDFVEADIEASSSSLQRQQHHHQHNERQDSLALLEQAVKPVLRFALMMATSRADALSGGQAMLAGICTATRSARLLAQAAVMYLRQHIAVIGRVSNHAASAVGDQLLDAIIHRVRPISLAELESLQRDVDSRMHTVAVLAFSLSRQLCDSVLRAEAALQSSPEMGDAMEATLSASQARGRLVPALENNSMAAAPAVPASTKATINSSSSGNDNMPTDSMTFAGNETDDGASSPLKQATVSSSSASDAVEPQRQADSGASK